MKRWLIGINLFICACLLSIYSAHTLYRMHTTERTEDISRFVNIPHSLAQAICLEFPGVVSDYLMLMTMTFHGERIIDEVKITPQEWQATLRAVQQIINLDPHFWDPYVLAQMSLPWDAGMINETNQLLLMAAETRVNDYRPYFYLWFNHSYFLNDPETAGAYLRKAARKPGAPKYFATLAARMSLYAGQTKSGILFLQEMISETTDLKTREHMERRLAGLRAIDFLENGMRAYKNRFHSPPDSLNDLVTSGIIQDIPNDPYGGNFYIMKDGRVYTTSKLALPPSKPKN